MNKAVFERRIKMRLHRIFLFLFIHQTWLLVSSDNLKKVIIFDSNIWIKSVYLFNHIIEQPASKSAGVTNYQELWNKLDGTSSAKGKLEEIVGHFNMDKYEEGVRIVQNILDLKKQWPNIEIDVPTFVYAEVAKGMTSKMEKPIDTVKGDYMVTYDNFFNSLPIKTNVAKQQANALTEGTDYPRKFTTNDPNKKEQMLLHMKSFLETNAPRNGRLTELIDYLKINIADKKKQIQNRFTQWKPECDNIISSGNIWEVKVKELYGRYYKSNAALLSDIAGKFIAYQASDLNKMQFTDPIDEIGKRLLHKSEEFDTFDLEIYLYAKEKQLPIVTCNTQAFQEIHDPVFLDYFSDIKVLNPNINFQNVHSLDQPFDLANIMKNALLQDFEALKNKLIGHLQKMSISAGKMIEFTKKTFDELKTAVEQRKNLKKNFEGMPFFDAINLLCIADNRIKINQNTLFSSKIFKDIKKKINALKILDQMLGSTITASDFQRTEATINDPQLNLKKDKTLAEFINSNRQDESHNLGEFLKLAKSDEHLKDAVKYAQVLFIKTKYDDESVYKAIETLVNAGEIRGPDPVDALTNPIRQCFSSGRRRKRGKLCRLNWDHIDTFNVEQEFRRDPKKVKIDSKKFLDFVKATENPVLLRQLYQYTDQLMNPANHYEGKIVGDAIHKMNRKKLIDHFNKVASVSGALNIGIFGKSILVDLMNNNIEGLAINIGSFGFDQYMFKISQFSEVKGNAYIAKSKFLGRSLKVASPFISRLGSTFIIYDLVKQVEALEGGDKYALGHVIIDGILLGVDGIGISAEISKSFGLISSSNTVIPNAITVIHTAVLIGSEIYFAYEHVDKINDILHLTTEEKFQEGLRHLVGVRESSLSGLAGMKSANEEIAKQAMQFLNEQSHIDKIIVPSGTFFYRRYRIMQFINAVFHVEDLIRTRPNSPEGGKIFCEEGDYKFLKNNIIPGPKAIPHQSYCSGAFGVSKLHSENNIIVFNFIDVLTISAIGQTNMQNIFIMSGGNFEGANKNDLFIVRKMEWKISINGLSGDDTLDISSVDHKSTFNVDFDKGIIVVEDVDIDVVDFSNINKFIGRNARSEIIKPDCGTNFIDGKGGVQNKPDAISIAPRPECQYNMTIILHENTIANNTASSGEFVYIIEENANNIQILGMADSKTTHTVFFKQELRALKLIDVNSSGSTKNLNILFDSNKITIRMVSGIFRFALKNNGEIRVDDNGILIILKTVEKVDDILEIYKEKAESWNISMIIQSESEHTTIILGDTGQSIFTNDPNQQTIIFSKSPNNIFKIDCNFEANDTSK